MPRCAEGHRARQLGSVRSTERESTACATPFRRQVFAAQNLPVERTRDGEAGSTGVVTVHADVSGVSCSRLPGVPDPAQLTPRSSSRYLVTVSSSNAGLTFARKHVSMERSAVPVRFTVSA